MDPFVLMWSKYSIYHSVSALRTEYHNKLQLEHAITFRRSNCYDRFKAIDESAPSRQYWKISRDLTKRRASTLIQLRTGHIPLKTHLHRINHASDPYCPSCVAKRETILHFILSCPKYSRAREASRHPSLRSLQPEKPTTQSKNSIYQLRNGPGTVYSGHEFSYHIVYS